MKKWLLRIVYAGLLFAPVAAYADYLATQGAGSTIFAFTCFTTKICPAHVITNSSGTEINTTANPAQIQVGDGTNQANVKAASTGAVATDKSLVVQESPNSQLSTAAGTTADAAYAGSGSASIVSILKGQYSAIVAPPTAGSASGGLSVKTLAALSNTAIAVKASAGQVYKVECFNPDASAKAYIQTFDVAAASVTMGTTAPKDFVGIAAGATAGFTLSLVGEQHATAISAGAATTATGGTAPTTALDCTIAYN